MFIIQKSKILTVKNSMKDQKYPDFIISRVQGDTAVGRFMEWISGLVFTAETTFLIEWTLLISPEQNNMQ